MLRTHNRGPTTKESAHATMPRRRFIIWGGVTVAAVVAACRDILTAPMSRPDSLMPQHSLTKAGGRLSRFARYPAPSYLPPHYELLMEQDDRPDGFRGTVGFGEDVTQTALVYRGPRAPKAIIPEATRYPLLFFATKAQGYQFAGTEGVDPLQYAIDLDGGGGVTAHYFDGMWEYPRLLSPAGKPLRPPPGTSPEWRRSSWHAMVYQWGEFTIGVRASRYCGVSFHELVKVVASTTALT